MKKILFIFLVLFVASSCTKLEDMNEDTKRPTVVPSETLFTNAQRELADQLASLNVNTNVFKLFAQYITETTYTDEANYDVINRGIPDNTFRNLYRDVFFSPILVNNLSDALFDLYEQNARGIYHISGSERVSKLEFGELIAEVFGYDKKYINPINFKDSNISALRPLDPSLDVTKASNTLGIKLLNARDKLIEMKKMLDNGYASKIKMFCEVD